MQDLNDKITGSTLTASEWNEVPSEIQNIIEGLGITLSGADLNQLGKAIAGYVANGNFYSESGLANAYVLSKIGSKQTSSAYTDGMNVEFIAGNSNTVSSTINVSGLGVKNIVNTGGSGIIVSGLRYQLRYRSGTGDFEIINSSQGIGKAWILFNGTGTVAIYDSFNVSSITDLATGQYLVNFTNDMSNINFAVLSSNFQPGGQDAISKPNAVGSAKIQTRNDSGADIDANYISVSVFSN